VVVDGARVDQMNDRELDRLRRHTVGFVFQSFGLLPLLSARENVELPLRIAGMGHRERRKRVDEALAFVGLGKRAEHRPYELSGGEQQRVAIARALAARPRLILADEPTGELDSATATAIFSLLRDLARVEGITIITCTHDRLVMELAGRVEELADGRLVTEGRREVLERTMARGGSPFAAARSVEPEAADGVPALSSLIGADLSQFRRPGSQAGSGDANRDAGDEAERGAGSPS
jgi:ABC-type lipoprotein export system ATPase subunit